MHLILNPHHIILQNTLDSKVINYLLDYSEAFMNSVDIHIHKWESRKWNRTEQKGNEEYLSECKKCTYLIHMLCAIDSIEWDFQNHKFKFIYSS